MKLVKKIINIKNAEIVVEDWAVWNHSGTKSHDDVNRIIAEYTFKKPRRMWLSPLTSRNPYTTHLFKYIRIIKYVDTMIANGVWDHNEVVFITNSPSVRRVLQKIISDHGKKWTVRYSLSLRKVLEIIKWAFWIVNLIARYIIVKWFFKTRDNKIDVLIDSFAFFNDCFGRHYYGRFVDWVNNRNNKDIAFVPEIIENNPIKVWGIIKKCSGGPYLFKESFLSVKDLVEVIAESVKSFPRCGAAKINKRIDITAVVNEEQNKLFQDDQVIRALLTIRFFKKYAASHKSPRLIVDWFENQIIDRGWNIGSRDAFPKCESVGYQSFGDLPGYWCIYPTDSEIAAAVIPKTIGIIGSEYINSRFKFAKACSVKICPAFRFEYLWGGPNVMAKTGKTVLVPLTTSRAVNERLLGIIKSFLMTGGVNSGITIAIKAHPVCALSGDVIKLLRDYHKTVFISKERFSALLTQSPIVFGESETSNTIFEAALYGVPVILLGSRGKGPRGEPNGFQNVIGGLKNVFYVSSENEFNDALETIRSRGDLDAKSVFVEHFELRSRHYRPRIDGDCEMFVGL
jgi:hypothetical protein